MVMEKKVTKMAIKVDLSCEKCRKKIRKVICKIPEIDDRIYDEKANKVTITVNCCCPEKMKQKIWCKGGQAIKEIKIIKHVTFDDTPKVFFFEPDLDTKKKDKVKLAPTARERHPKTVEHLENKGHKAMVVVNEPAPGYPILPTSYSMMHINEDQLYYGTSSQSYFTGYGKQQPTPPYNEAWGYRYGCEAAHYRAPPTDYHNEDGCLIM